MNISIQKRKYILLLYLVLNSVHAFSQRPRVFALPSFTPFQSVSWHDSTYRFPDFQKGKIIYNNGFELKQTFDLNYNVYFEKMHFIDSNGDTLSITDTRGIRLVEIGDVTFFHDYKTGYYEVVSALPVSLIVRNTFDLSEVLFSNGSHGSIATDTRGVTSPYDRLYKLAHTFFLIDLREHIYEVTHNNILKLFSEHNKKIREYLIEHPVDFKSRDDMVRLITYCNGLNEASGN